MSTTHDMRNTSVNTGFRTIGGINPETGCFEDGPFAAPVIGPFTAPETGRFVAPETGRFEAPVIGRFEALVIGPFTAPETGPFAAPEIGRFKRATLEKYKRSIDQAKEGDRQYGRRLTSAQMRGRALFSPLLHE